MLDVFTRFSTLRMVAGQKEPMILEVDVKNNGEKTELVSVTVKVPFSLGFDRVGLMREQRKRVGEIKAGMTKTVPFMIYCKPGIKENMYNLEVKVSTHPGRYDKVDKTISKVATMRVISR